MSVQFDQLRQLAEVYLKPLAPFLRDPTVTEIMVNKGGSHVGDIFIERRGLIESTTAVLDPALFGHAISRIARWGNDETDEDQPLLNAHLADGSRVAVMLPPSAVDGPTMSIRKFGERYTLAQLIAAGGLTHKVAALLVQAVADRRNILIAGGTSTGKTTLLNALTATIHDRDRIFLIEDNAEILIQKPNLVRGEAKRQNGAFKGVTIRDLVAVAMRFRPDRIILGEVRGAEAFDLLTALNSGHQGSLCTIHGNSSLDALRRLGEFVLMSQVPLPHAHVLASIARNFQVVVYIARDYRTGQRAVTEVLALHGYDHQTEQFLTTPLYPPEAACTT